MNEEVFTEGWGDRPLFTNIMIAITDGVPNLKWEETDHVKQKMNETRRNAMSAKNRGIKILGMFGHMDISISIFVLMYVSMYVSIYLSIYLS